MSKVYLALQDNDEARYIVEAIEIDNPDISISYAPAMIRLENEDSLTINKATVVEQLGRDWEIPELQLCLITLGGNVEETDDSFSLTWN